MKDFKIKRTVLIDTEDEFEGLIECIFSIPAKNIEDEDIV